MSSAETLAPPAVRMSVSAVRRIGELLAAEDRPDVALRITVSGGGCSGFQYGFNFDDQTTAEDHVFAESTAKLVIDEASLELLNGAEIDYVEDLVGSSFQIRNPNAASSCGCGNSFSLG